MKDHACHLSDISLSITAEIQSTSLLEERIILMKCSFKFYDFYGGDFQIVVYWVLTLRKLVGGTGVPEKRVASVFILHTSILKIEAESSLEISVFAYKTTRCHNPEINNLKV
jgi:hypothetical protein